MAYLALALLGAAATVAAASATSAPLPARLGAWPLPRSVTTAPAWSLPTISGQLDVPVVPILRFELAQGSLSTPRLLRGIARYNTFLPTLAAGVSGAPVRVYVPPTATEVLSLVSEVPTLYNYSIAAGGAGPAFISAPSSYGAMYGMETLAQIATAHGGLPALSIVDAPTLTWRGLMLDAGRRFFNVSLVQNILDTMAGTKLNVLHWHLSDDCRFGVESKLYPAATSSLTGLLGGFYTASDVARCARGWLSRDVGRRGQVAFCPPRRTTPALPPSPAQHRGIRGRPWHFHRPGV